MKKIALILAVIMMFSAVSALAAPSVEFMFYGVDEETGVPAIYVFGKYTNNSTTSGTWVSEDVGVYYNGNKYSYVKDGNTTNKTGLFGIAFDDPNGIKDKKTGFTVQPYSVDKYGEDLGAEQSYDFENNNKKVSSNAKLASVSIVRKQESKGGLMALMDPVFDPDVEEYIIYGYFQNANYNLTNLELLCIPQDPEATVVMENTFGTVNATTGGFTNNLADDKYANYTTVTVTAKDGVTKKTYTFKFNSSSTSAYYSNTANVARPIATGSFKLLEEGEIKGPGTNGAIYAYPQIGSAKSQYGVWEFNITDGMKAAEIITMNIGNINGTASNDMENVVIAARAYDDVTGLGMIDGKFVIPDSDAVPTSGTTYCPCGINVTNIVKQAIEANQTTVKIAIEIVDLESNGGNNVPGFKLLHYSYSGTNGRSVSLCWK